MVAMSPIVMRRKSRSVGGRRVNGLQTLSLRFGVSLDGSASRS